MGGVTSVAKVLTLTKFLYKCLRKEVLFLSGIGELRGLFLITVVVKYWGVLFIECTVLVIT